jgi:aminoglycoside/choline kinase family phosphotransferase
MSEEILIAQQLVDRSLKLNGAKVTALEMLAGDMSSRQFARLSLSGSQVSSAILVILSHAPGPVGGGTRNLTQDDTYVEVGQYLTAHNVRVPELYADGRDIARLLVEDVGSLSLFKAAQDPNQIPPQILARLGAAPLTELYLKALKIQRQIANLPHDQRHVIFQRSTTAEQRALQINEFLEHYATPRGISERASSILKELMREVCLRVERHPKVVSHFDYMASNIHVLPTGELCVLDFQDMCLDSPARDVVSLLNDRDSDSALGKLRHTELLKSYLSALNGQPNFSQLYNEYLLLWDLRVSGRFALLAEKRGIANYSKWIPGTLRRLGRTLYRVRDTIPYAAETLKELSAFSLEIKHGVEDPWELPLN